MVLLTQLALDRHHAVEYAECARVAEPHFDGMLTDESVSTPLSAIHMLFSAA